MLAGLQVAGGLEDEVEAGVEGQLLQEVVVDAGTGCDVDAARAVEGQADAHPRLGGGPDVARAAATGRGDGRGAVECARQPLEQEVVVVLVAHGRADAVREDAHDEPRAEERRAELRRLLDGHEDEVGSRRQRLEAQGAKPACEALALLDLRGDVGRVGEGGHRECRREGRDRRGRLAPVELGGGVRVGERVADAPARQAERLRERAEDDDSLADPPGGRLARVLVVGLVHDQRPGRGEVAERAGRVVRPAAERDRRVVVGDVRAGQVRGDAEERVRRLVGDGHAVARAGEGSGAEEDEIVGPGAQHDVLGLDAGVAGDRRGQLRVAAVRVVLDVGERRGERARTGGGDGPGRDVAVEADDLVGVELEPGAPARGSTAPTRRP